MVTDLTKLDDSALLRLTEPNKIFEWTSAACLVIMFMNILGIMLSNLFGRHEHTMLIEGLFFIFISFTLFRLYTLRRQQDVVIQLLKNEINRKPKL